MASHANHILNGVYKSFLVDWSFREYSDANYHIWLKVPAKICYSNTAEGPRCISLEVLRYQIIPIIPNSTPSCATQYISSIDASHFSSQDLRNWPRCQRLKSSRFKTCRRTVERKWVQPLTCPNYRSLLTDLRFCRISTSSYTTRSTTLPHSSMSTRTFYCLSMVLVLDSRRPKLNQGRQNTPKLPTHFWFRFYTYIFRKPRPALYTAVAISDYQADSFLLQRRRGSST